MALKLYPEPPTDVETYPSAFLGIRSWRVSRSGEPLRAAFFDASPWLPGITRATCSHCRRVPNPVWDASDRSAHRCGLHAYHSIEHLRSEQKVDLTQLVTGDQVIGIVAGRGNIEVHEDGWRSEEAQVLGLLAPSRPHLYVCPFCERAPDLRARCAFCQFVGVVAGASNEEGLIRVDFDHDEARERIEAVAAHHGVAVFDTIEEMMQFGASLAAPAPMHLRVRRQPLWARSWFQDARILSLLTGVLALAATVGLLAVEALDWLVGGKAALSQPIAPTAAICGSLAALCVVLAVTTWMIETALRWRARRVWRAFMSRTEEDLRRPLEEV